MSRRTGSVLLTFGLALVPCMATAGTRHIDVANTAATGDKIRGPVTLYLERVNRLRYEIHLDNRTAFTPGPALPLLPALPSTPATGGAGGAGAPRTAGLVAPNPISDEFSGILDRMKDVERAQADVEQAVALAADATRQGRDAVDSLVRASDGVLQGSGAGHLIDEIEAVIPLAETGLSAPWPSAAIANYHRGADVLAADLARLPHQFSAAWPAWYQGMNKAQYDDAVEEADALRAYGAALGPGGALLQAFHSTQAGLGRWLPILRAARDEGVDFFILTHHAGCDFSFDKTRTTTITLVAMDRLAAPGAPTVSREVITVECTTPFSVSAGIGYSMFTDEIEFGFAATTRTGTDAQGAPTTRVTKEFAELKRSDFRVSPILLVNTRIAEWSDTLALHFSFGAVVDMEGSAGTDVEWVAGASVSFKRSLFLTAAFHAARVPKLGGGFAVGDEVPAAVTEPPIEKELDKALLIGVTFRIRP